MGDDVIRSGIVQATLKNCDLDVPEPCGLVIFGASGDLAQRKIIPALFHLCIDRLMPGHFFILGAARTPLSDREFRASMSGAIKEAAPRGYTDELCRSFTEKLSYVSIDYSDASTYQAIADRLKILETEYATGGNRIFYLAIPPLVYETVLVNLGESGLAHEEGCYSRVVVEKPLGRDLASARNLNRVLGKCFEEQQIYRMDHYLAKETVQNILMFRFANSIFEPLWNRRYIDHVEITVSETAGIEQRAGYYEQAGVLRDMFQNHIFQLLALTAMEPPSLFAADRVQDEKVKVFQSIRPFDLARLKESVVIGQYGKGLVKGDETLAYREEENVAPESATPTYAAMRVFIDNWRWQGVPFYLRSGKRLAVRKAEVSIHYRPVPHLMFSQALREGIEANTLVLRLQPNEGIDLSFQVKNPGSRVCLNTVLMDFSYRNVFMLEDYERILLDCMQGDQMLFPRADGVELAWELLTPVIEKLEAETDRNAFPNYTAGSAGPVLAADLLARGGRTWRPL